MRRCTTKVVMRLATPARSCSADWCSNDLVTQQPLRCGDGIRHFGCGSSCGFCSCEHGLWCVRRRCLQQEHSCGCGWSSCGFEDSACRRSPGAAPHRLRGWRASASRRRSHATTACLHRLAHAYAIVSAQRGRRNARAETSWIRAARRALRGSRACSIRSRWRRL